MLTNIHNYNGTFTYVSQGSNPAARTLRDMSTPEGVVTKSGGNYYYKYFLRDYLGNVRDVLSCSKSGGYQEEQFTNYDPLGLAISKIGNDNPYLYNGKELYSDFSDAYDGVYDFGARYYNPLYGRWFAPDPGKQHPNPYIYCGNNPVMKIDPDGRIWDDIRDKFRILRELRRERRNLRRENRNMRTQVRKKTLTSREQNSLESQISENEERIGLLSEGINAVYILDKDMEHTYRLENTTGENYHSVRLGNDGFVYIQGADLGFQLHEIMHAKQGVVTGRFQFSSETKYMLNPGYEAPAGRSFRSQEEASQVFRRMSDMEIEAYRVQHALTGYFPTGPISSKDINYHSIGSILNQKGEPVYWFTNQYNRYLNFIHDR